uniref:U11/U12 small nuclear ribonucleoprotein 31 kDa protein isoform X1 n=1 Tax=Elaeis guineensis var. tenera TaxID=51953 RepID=A0A6J0PG41_ELAGV|nr:U11/U12 small nuclear ribonucleoprotein 31 kDa protein isoform X1 [Elaeis guineensis]
MFAAIFSPISSNPPLSRPRCSPSSLPSNGMNPKASLPNLPIGSRLFVSNLPFSIGEATLIKLFSKFGRIVEVKLAKHEETKKSKGYAFIQYSSQDDALLAMEQMDQRVPYLNPTLLLSFPPSCQCLSKEAPIVPCINKSIMNFKFCNHECIMKLLTNFRCRWPV